jgi:CTP:molybdopterin cytidylyltransferase MocA
MAVVGILLAAGESRRMDRPKALLPWGSAETLVEYQIKQLQQAGCGLVIVVYGATPEVASVAARCGATVVENKDWREGRASSTRAGASAAPPDTEIVIVVSVDQPAPASVIGPLLEQMSENPAVIYVPSYKGQRGHPVALPGKHLAELREVQEETMGLRDLVEAYPPMEVDVDDPIVTADINTPEDYARWHRRVFGTAPRAD